MPTNPRSGVHPDNYLDWYERVGVPLPSFTQHGVTDSNIREKMTPMRPNKWILDGNRLIGDTEMGEVTLNLPTNYILESSQPDAKGLPRLRKLV